MSWFLHFSADIIWKELRGYAHIGMMEQWNCGMMGFKKTEFKTHNFTLPSIPIFHYSIIPCGLQKNMATKINIISISCRNSETFN
jgi:hypothetical protein